MSGHYSGFVANSPIYAIDCNQNRRYVVKDMIPLSARKTDLYVVAHIQLITKVANLFLIL